MVTAERRLTVKMELREISALQGRKIGSLKMPLFALKFQQKDVNDKEYPPLFKFDIIWNISLGSAIQLECLFQFTPAEMKLEGQHPG